MALRQRVWIDRRVQGVLIGRVFIYWMVAIFYFGASLLCGQWWQNPDWSMGEHLSAFAEQVWPWLPSIVLLLPLVLFDIVRLSHQFAGPVYRLRLHLDTLQSDNAATPLAFRDGDYWQELVDPINWLQSEIQRRDQKIEALEFILDAQNTQVWRVQRAEESLATTST